MLTLAEVAALQAIVSVELGDIYHEVHLEYHEWEFNNTTIINFFMIALDCPDPEMDDLHAHMMDAPRDYEHACDILDETIDTIRWFNSDVTYTIADEQ